MTAPLSDALLAEIEARWSDASPGPWKILGYGDELHWWLYANSEDMPIGSLDARYPDLEAIAHAPDDVARLLADLRLARYTLAGIARVIDAEADDASWDAGTARRLLARIAVAAHAGLGDLQTWLHEEETT